jgi:SET domain-containing protein
MKSTSKLNSKIRVIDHKGRKGLFARAVIRAGETLIDLCGEKLLSAPTRESLQVSAHTHVVGRVGTVGCLNHACEPNARLATEGDSIIALYDIAAGEEITVNYLATEYDMHEDFLCECGSPVCFGRIHGFRHLSDRERLRLLPLLAPYLRVQVRAVDACAGAA